MDELKQNLYALHDFETLIFEGKFRTGSVARIVQELRTDNVEQANDQFDLLRESGEGEGEIWYHIVAAYSRSKAGRMLEAKQELRRLLEYTEIESRLRIWAWNKLRQWSVEPEPEIADQVYGVVLEVGVPDGVELVAAYEDGSSRYINKSGTMIVWDLPDDKNTVLAQKITATAQTLINHLPLVEAPNLSTAGGQVQMSALTAGGLRALTLPMSELRRTAAPLAPLFNASTELLVSLIKTVENARK